jgi:hypothetical protein
VLAPFSPFQIGTRASLSSEFPFLFSYSLSVSDLTAWVQVGMTQPKRVVVFCRIPGSDYWAATEEPVKRPCGETWSPSEH